MATCPWCEQPLANGATSCGACGKAVPVRPSAPRSEGRPGASAPPTTPIWPGPPPAKTPTPGTPTTPPKPATPPTPGTPGMPATRGALRKAAAESEPAATDASPLGRIRAAISGLTVPPTVLIAGAVVLAILLGVGAFLIHRSRTATQAVSVTIPADVPSYSAGPGGFDASASPTPGATSSWLPTATPTGFPTSSPTLPGTGMSTDPWGSTYAPPTLPVPSTSSTPSTTTPVTSSVTPARPTYATGAWVLVLESLEKNLFSAADATTKAATIGATAVVIDSGQVTGLRGGYWAIVAPGSFTSRANAAAACPTFSRALGDACYPRQVG